MNSFLSAVIFVCLAFTDVQKDYGYRLFDLSDVVDVVVGIPNPRAIGVTIGALGASFFGCMTHLLVASGRVYATRVSNSAAEPV